MKGYWALWVHYGTRRILSHISNKKDPLREVEGSGVKLKCVPTHSMV